MTHIAGNRIVFCEPLPQKISLHAGNLSEYMKREEIISNIMKRSKRVPIGLPFDDMSFTDDTAKECAERLVNLKKIGYNVPQYAIDSLLAEANNARPSTTN